MGDIQLVNRFALGKINAGMVIEFVDKIASLTLAKVFDGQFPAQQNRLCMISKSHR